MKAVSAILAFALLAAASAQQCSTITTVDAVFNAVSKDGSCKPDVTATKQTYYSCKKGLECNDSFKCAEAPAFKPAEHATTACTVMTAYDDCKFGTADAQYGGSCVNKKCYYRRYPGEACEANEDCVMYNNGNTDAGCKENKCAVETKKVDEACTATTALPATQACVDLKVAAMLAVGDECTSDTLCPSGTMCNTKATKKTCVVMGTLAAGELSASTALCKPSAPALVSDKCSATRASGAATGAECTTDTDCKSVKDECVCSGDKKAVCKTNPYFDATMGDMSAVYTCMSTSGCSKMSNMQDPKSCAHECDGKDTPTTASQCAAAKESIWSINGGDEAKADSTSATYFTALGYDYCSSSSATAVALAAAAAAFAAAATLL